MEKEDELKKWKEEQNEVLCGAFDDLVNNFLEYNEYYYMNKDKLISHLLEHIEVKK